MADTDSNVVSLQLYKLHGFRSDEEYRQSLLNELKSRIHSYNGPPVVMLDFDRRTESEPSDG